MPERYTGTPNFATAAAIRGASLARASAWLPITISGRFAREIACAARSTLGCAGAGGVAARAAGEASPPPPENIFRTWRCR